MQEFQKYSYLVVLKKQEISCDEYCWWTARTGAGLAQLSLCRAEFDLDRDPENYF